MIIGPKERKLINMNIFWLLMIKIHQIYSQIIFQKTLHDFHKQKHHDWLKRRYCRKNGIKFFEIWYWENEIEKIKSILK